MMSVFKIKVKLPIVSILPTLFSESIVCCISMQMSRTKQELHDTNVSLFISNVATNIWIFSFVRF